MNKKGFAIGSKGWIALVVAIFLAGMLVLVVKILLNGHLENIFA